MAVFSRRLLNENFAVRIAFEYHFVEDFTSKPNVVVSEEREEAHTLHCCWFVVDIFLVV